MLIKRFTVPERSPFSSLVIEPTFPGRDFRFDVAIGRLSGIHPTMVNNVSDRAYYMISGQISFRVGDSHFDAEEGDVVIVPKGTVHSSEGEGEYLIVTSPPFDPANEMPAE